MAIILADKWCPLLLAADNIVGYHDEIEGTDHTTHVSIPSEHLGEIPSLSAALLTSPLSFSW